MHGQQNKEKKSAWTVIVLVTQVNEDKKFIHRWCECFVSSVRAVCYRTIACKTFHSNNYITFSQEYRRKTDS